MIKWDLSQGCKNGTISANQSISMIYHMNKSKNKYYIIILIDAEKAFDKIQHLFIIKTLHKMYALKKYM